MIAPIPHKHIVSLTARERDILITYNDGTWQTSIQPAADIERAATEVNALAARRAHDAAARATDEGTARWWRRLAMGIDVAPRVRGHVVPIERARVGA